MFGVCRSLWARAIWLLWPAWVWFSVIGTGNHYWLDVVAGVAIAVSLGGPGASVSRPSGRTVPASWSAVSTAST